MAEKIVVEEFDVCQKFVDNLVRCCCNIGSQKTHVSCDDFVIFINCNNSSAKLINKEIIYNKKVYTDKLDLYGWKIYRPLIEKHKAPSYSQYENCIKIIFTVINKKMACFSLIYQKYLEIMQKNWILDIAREDGFVLIKITGNRDDTYPYKELAELNRLFDECKISEYGFQCFILKEIISIKNITIQFLFLNLPGFKKMEYIRFARNIYTSMNNVVNERKAQKLDSISLARCFCFMLCETEPH